MLANADIEFDDYGQENQFIAAGGTSGNFSAYNNVMEQSNQYIYQKKAPAI